MSSEAGGELPAEPEQPMDTSAMEDANFQESTGQPDQSQQSEMPGKEHSSEFPLDKETGMDELNAELAQAVAQHMEQTNEQPGLENFAESQMAQEASQDMAATTEVPSESTGTGEQAPPPVSAPAPDDSVAKGDETPKTAESASEQAPAEEARIPTAQPENEPSKPSEDIKPKEEGEEKVKREEIPSTETNGQKEEKVEIKKEPAEGASTPLQKKEEERKRSQRNKATMTRTFMISKGITCRPQAVHKDVQTVEVPPPTLAPIPVPMYTPIPMQMYEKPYPVPVPIPLPVPVPIFVPTTRNTTRGIQKFMKKVKAKLPDNVFEAQILEMAGEMQGKEDPLDSDDSPWEDYEEEYDEQGNPVPVEAPKPNIPDEDVEKIVKAGNIVPKPLPQPTPDACPPPANYGYRGGFNQGVGRGGDHGMKRPYGGDDHSNQPKRGSYSRGRSRGRKSQASRSANTAENNPALAALSLPPKERPDAKHHLKVKQGIFAW